MSLPERAQPPPLPRLPSFVGEERRSRFESTAPVRRRASFFEVRSDLIEREQPSPTSVTVERTNPGLSSLSAGQALYALSEPLSGAFAREPTGSGMMFVGDDSVIARAFRMRRTPLARLQAGLEQLGRSARTLFVEDLPLRLRLWLHPSRRARQQSRMQGALARRFSSLSPRQQRTVTVLPYIVAMLFGALAIYLVLSEATPKEIESQPVPSTQLAALTPVPDPVPEGAAATATQVDSVNAPPEPPAGEAPAPMVAVTRVVPIRSSLRPSASVHASRVARIAPGSEVATYPAFAAPEGWILAQTTSGHIGFMPALNLEGQRDQRMLAELRKKKSKKRRKKRRKRR